MSSLYARTFNNKLEMYQSYEYYMYKLSHIIYFIGFLELIQIYSRYLFGYCFGIIYFQLHLQPTVFNFSMVVNERTRTYKFTHNDKNTFIDFISIFCTFFLNRKKEEEEKEEENSMKIICKIIWYNVDFAKRNNAWIM